MSKSKDNEQRIPDLPQQDPATYPADMEDERESPERGDDKPLPPDTTVDHATKPG